MADPDPALLAEINDLRDRRLLGVELAPGQVVGPGETYGSAGALAGTNWSTIRPTDVGSLLARLTGADRLPREERNALVAALDRSRTS